MKPFRPLRIVALLALFTAGSGARADACSCMASGPPCQEAWTADAVFAGIVRSVGEVEHRELGPSYRERLVRFQIERAFRNAAPGTVEVVTGQSGASCGFDFVVGRRYLVYARTSPVGRFQASLCSRTRPIEEAAEDLRYLESMPASSTGARVYGRVKQIEWDPGPAQLVDYGPHEAIRVFLHGPALAREVYTDAQGRYEIRDVPAGAYRIAIDVPPEFDSRYLERDFAVKDVRGCVQHDFDIRWEARLTGVVLDEAGQPAAGVTVEVIAEQQAEAPSRGFSRPEAKTDASGFYELAGIPPGRYVVVVNLPRPWSKTPSSPTWYPGTPLLRDAAVVELEPGDRKTLPPFRLAARK